MFSCLIFEATCFSVSGFNKHLRNKHKEIKKLKLLNISCTQIVTVENMTCVQLKFNNFSFFYIRMFIS
jgi:hypothetical protein